MVSVVLVQRMDRLALPLLRFSGAPLFLPVQRERGVVGRGAEHRGAKFPPILSGGCPQGSLRWAPSLGSTHSSRLCSSWAALGAPFLMVLIFPSCKSSPQGQQCLRGGGGDSGFQGAPRGGFSGGETLLQLQVPQIHLGSTDLAPHRGQPQPQSREIRAPKICQGGTGGCPGLLPLPPASGDTGFVSPHSSSGDKPVAPPGLL